MFLATSIVALIAGELFVRLIDSNMIIYDLEMAKYATLLKVNSKNTDRCHQHKKNSHARLMGVDVATNSLGLRDKEYGVVKPNHAYRILVLGDSLTLGWGVKQDDCYSKRLEVFLNKRLSAKTGLVYEVINSGVGNYNTVQEWTYFIEEGYQLDPDMIILGFYINDAEPVPTRTKSFFLNYSHLAVLLWSRANIIMARFFSKESYKEYYDDLYRNENMGWVRCKKALRELIEYGKLNSKKVVIAFIPELHDLSDNYPFKEAHQKVGDYMQSQESAHYFNLYEDLRGGEGKSLWVSYEDAHPNKNGHELIAEAIYKHLTTKRILQ